MSHASRYNVAVAGNAGETLLFNTATGAFAALDTLAAAEYEQLADTQNGAAPAPERAGGLQRQLEEAGFFTNSSPQEELAAVRRGFCAQRDDWSELTLALAPTYACNYRCPYCYETDVRCIPGKMDTRVMDGVMRFIQARHQQHAFTALSVQWYGGDPSLALDVVEELSRLMIEWCAQHGVRYQAMMLSNCARINQTAVVVLQRSKVTGMLLTIDGFEQMHNQRRIAADGSNSYRRVLNAARLFVERGMQVSAIMNIDRVNRPEFEPLRNHLRQELGVELTMGRLGDFAHSFGSRGFKEPEFCLYSPLEYAQLCADEFEAREHSAAELQTLLAPALRFCNGQRDPYFVIDCRGDIYDCDGYIGRPEHRVASILDAEETIDGSSGAHPCCSQLHFVSHDPFASAECSACHLLPMCMGNCKWVRETDQMQCHPLLWTLPRYLRVYRHCFKAHTSGFTLLEQGQGTS